MKKRLLSALRWIDAASKNDRLKIVGPDVQEHLQPETRGEDDFSQASLAAAMGVEEWFLAYEMNPNGSIDGHGENTTFSLSLSPDGFARVKSYTLTRDESNGKQFTAETDCNEGSWEIERNVLSLRLPDEILEFIVARVENGVATLVDPDDGCLSVLMTESAFKIAL